MKKLLAPLIAFLSYLMLAPSVFAKDQLIGCPQFPFDKLCFNETNVPGIISAAITFIFVIAVIIAIFYLLLGAVKWIYSGGDKVAIESARGTITAAVIGLVILFLVFLIFTLLLRFFGFGIENITNIPAITNTTTSCLPKGSTCTNPFLCCSKVCTGTPLLCN